MSPVSTDSTNSLPSETFEQRLGLLIEELNALRPDVIAFSEATITKAHGSAVARLAKELKMEFQYVRANPWFPGQTQAQNDDLVKQIGFEEGELILSRYPIIRYKKGWLNPRTSETEGRAVLHVVVKGPGEIGEVDIYVTHLTGGEERVRTAQAKAVLNFVAMTRGAGPTLIMGDLSETPGSPAPQAIVDWGMTDVSASFAGEAQRLTCCRDGIAGEVAAPTMRTDFIFAERWKATAVGPFAETPGKRLDAFGIFRGAFNDVVVDVSDIAHISNCITARAQITCHEVEYNQHARVAYMAIVVHRHAANVHAYLAGFDRRERLFLIRKSVINLQHGHQNNSFKICSRR